MPLSAAVGQAAVIDAHEAAQLATRQALDGLGRATAAAGIIIASNDYSMPAVLSGAASLLGNTPLWGFSTICPVAAGQANPHSVVIGLISGEEIRAHSFWSAEFSQDSAAAGRRLVSSLPQDPWLRQAILIAADGTHGDAARVCTALPDSIPPTSGCLSGSRLPQEKTFQLGGNQVGSGGISWMYLIGKIRAGQGWGHGWQNVGPYFQVTRAGENTLGELDHISPVEAYCRWFGIPAQEWTEPPLAELVRLYPLALETGPEKEPVVRAALRVEPNGSFKMGTAIRKGSIAHLMVGSQEGCLVAARNAAIKALAELDQARPILALVWIDHSWQMLFGSPAGAELEQIREVLGPEIPIIGAYCPGQISGQPPQLLNQHIVICLLGETRD